MTPTVRLEPVTSSPAIAAAMNPVTCSRPTPNAALRAATSTLGTCSRTGVRTEAGTSRGAHAGTSMASMNVLISAASMRARSSATWPSARKITRSA